MGDDFVSVEEEGSRPSIRTPDSKKYNERMARARKEVTPSISKEVTPSVSREASFNPSSTAAGSPPWATYDHDPLGPSGFDISDRVDSDMSNTSLSSRKSSSLFGGSKKSPSFKAGGLLEAKSENSDGTISGSGGSSSKLSSAFSSSKKEVDKTATDLAGLVVTSQSAATNIKSFNFEFNCERKKCGASMQISGEMFRAALQEDLRKKKFKGVPKVQVACAKCGKLHSLQAPAEVMSGLM